MSTWSSLANNKYISTNNIQYGVIAGSISLFTGNTLTFSNQPNQWIDKLTFSNSVPHGTLSTTFNNKLDNQWITKTDIIPGMECPCNYSITYSSITDTYYCFNLTNALPPVTFSSVQRVTSNYWNRLTWNAITRFPRLYEIGYNNKGIGTFTTFGVKQDNSYNRVWINQYSNYNDGRMNSTAIWVKDGFVTVAIASPDQYDGNGYYNNSISTIYSNSNAIWVPVNTWIGILYTYNIVEQKTYYFGINGDNYVKVSINGEVLIDNSTNTSDTSGTFLQWCIYPITLNIGKYDFNFSVYNGKREDISNGGNPGGFAAELYDFTGLTNSTYTTLSSALSDLITSTASLDSYIVFSTKDMESQGLTWNIGKDIAYSDPITDNYSVLSPDENGVVKCLATYPQTNYALGCQEYLTFVVGITGSNSNVIYGITPGLGCNNGAIPAVGIFNKFFHIDFGDGTPIVDTGSLTFTYSQSNIPPYTGNNVYTATFRTIPVGLSPSFYQNIPTRYPGATDWRYPFPNVPYTPFYQDSYTNVTSYGVAQYYFVYISHTYSNVGTYNIKLYPDSVSISAGDNISISYNSGNLRYVTSTNNLTNYLCLDLHNNIITNFGQNFDSRIYKNLKSQGLVYGTGNTYFGPGTMDFSYINLIEFNPTLPILFDASNNGGVNDDRRPLILNNNLLTNYDPKPTLNFYNLYLKSNLISYFNPINKQLPYSNGGKLDLSYNIIATMSSMSYSIPNYSTIDISHNLLKYFDPYYISNGISYSVLTQSTSLTLTLNNNLLTNFNPSIGLSACNINLLNLSYNPLSIYSAINTTDNIKQMFLSNCYLGTGSTYFSTDKLPSNIRSLYLDSNPFIGISASVFNTISGLQYLSIYNCPNYHYMTPDFNQIKFTQSSYGFGDSTGFTGSTLYMTKLNGFTVSSSVTFDDNLNQIYIQSDYYKNMYFNPASLPTNLKKLTITAPSNGCSFNNDFNFDLLLPTKINYLFFQNAYFGTATASSLLPNTLKTINICGCYLGEINPLGTFSPNLLPTSVTYLDLSFCSLTSSVLQTILDTLVSNGATSGTLYINNQYSPFTYSQTNITPGMSASLHTLINNNWKCYATTYIRAPNYNPILFT